MEKLIKKYTQLQGVSGNTQKIKAELKDVFLKAKNCQIIEDNLGGVGLKICSSRATKTIAIMAHQDEVGLMVQNIKKNGRVQVVPIGGLTIESLISQRVVYTNHEQDYVGIIMAPSPHVKSAKITKFNELEVDFGFESPADAKTISLEVGSILNFCGNFHRLQNQNFVAKACDNRIGIAVLEHLTQKFANQDLQYNLILGATVQEEVGLRGVHPLLTACACDIDEVYVIDVSPVDGMEEYELGKGPLLRIMEPRSVFSPKLYDKVLRLAESVPTQPYFARGGTDTTQVQIHGSGIAATAICIPGLNLHTPSTICNLDDIDNMIKLLEKIIEE